MRVISKNNSCPICKVILSSFRLPASRWSSCPTSSLLPPSKNKSFLIKSLEIFSFRMLMGRRPFRNSLSTSVSLKSMGSPVNMIRNSLRLLFSKNTWKKTIIDMFGTFFITQWHLFLKKNLCIGRTKTLHIQPAEQALRTRRYWRIRKRCFLTSLLQLLQKELFWRWRIPSPYQLRAHNLQRLRPAIKVQILQKLQQSWNAF